MDAEHYELDPEKIDWAKTYQDRNHLAVLAVNLINFGGEAFKGARIIRDWAYLEELQRRRQAGVMSETEFTLAVLPFVMDYLVDQVRFCIYFENYMKARLLLKQVIIHRIKDQIEPTQPKGQRNATIAEQFDKQVQKAPIDAEGLAQHRIATEIQQETISLDTMLKAKYQVAIGLPEDVRLIVKTMNRQRNKLHLRTDVQFTTEVLDDIKRLKAFVDGENEWLQRTFFKRS
ncbi:MAG: hypothetical protein IPM46_11160 [Flavobacteriales bacterium]|nr:hypothetical protein [Flavobacteriales bacterium]